MNKDIFDASPNQLFDHYECFDCGRTFLGFDSYRDHVLDEHDEEVLYHCSEEECARLDACAQYGGCDYEFDSHFHGAPLYKCKRCGWLMWDL